MNGLRILRQCTVRAFLAKTWQRAKLPGLIFRHQSGKFLFAKFRRGGLLS
ncbi:MAG: hypothetical protein ACK4Q5_13155 [Saprospiraceae bacterium]